MKKGKSVILSYTVSELSAICKEVRISILDMIRKAGSGHPGGSLSLVELLVSLFFEKVKRTKENALSPNRDRVILSKGHGVPSFYAIFAKLGLIAKESLESLRELNSPLQGHPDFVRLPYVEASTGSLGQGLSIGEGMAMAGKLDKKDYRVYVIIGDGEIQEGQIWEALMSAPKYKLDNLCVILDYNKAQLDGYVKDIMDIEPIADKLRAFNWEVLEIDGHSISAIREAYDKAASVKGRPCFIVAHTVKGKGVSFMEGDNAWHGVAPDKEQYNKALSELTS